MTISTRDNLLTLVAADEKANFEEQLTEWKDVFVGEEDFDVGWQQNKELFCTPRWRDIWGR